MLDLWVWDITGSDRQCVASSDSFQMTGTEIRTDNDKVVLYWNTIESMWVVMLDGSEWYDFTIGKAE